MNDLVHPPKDLSTRVYNFLIEHPVSLMCEVTYEVTGLDDKRKEYEVEEYLKGIPHISDVTADFIEDTITIEWDEDLTTSEKILDEIEHSGCKPATRINGIVEGIRSKLA